MKSRPGFGRAWLGAWAWVWITLACLPAVRAESPVPATQAGRLSQQHGTGFVVDTRWVVTAAHVLGASPREVSVRRSDETTWRAARLVKLDAVRDLALLEVADLAAPSLALSDGDVPPLGLEAFVIGHPDPGLYGPGLKFFAGVVNGEFPSRAGAPRRIQFSAEVYKGCSGGPLLAPDGRVLGVVLGKLDALKVAERTRDLPQNVSFALRVDELRAFLQDTPALVRTEGLDPQVLQRPHQVAARARAAIVAVRVRRPNPASPLPPPPPPEATTAEP